MDFYVIPPTADCELMNHGDRFFCLAQLYMKERNSHYREFFKQKVKEGKWVTLDNGAGDHDIVTHKDLFRIMVDLAPSEVIPPDFLFDGINTIRNLEVFTRSMYDADHIGRIEVLACPQGRTKEEWMFVYEYMLKHPHVNTIGMSKIAIPSAFLDETNDSHIKEARHMCVSTLLALGLITKPLHFLGMGDPTEFSTYKKGIEKFARSTDSCNSIWAAMNGISFVDGKFERVPTPKDYFDRKVSDFALPMVMSNIGWMRSQLHS